MGEPNVILASRLMGRKPINPIGNCFDNCALQAILMKNPPENLRICHGIGVANMPGQIGNAIGHAWLEWDGLVYDTTWGCIVYAKKYREDLKISFVVEYSRSQFLKLWKKHDYPGPWENKILRVINKNQH